MKKQMYIQPSVKAVEIAMVQTLCASGGGSSSDPGVSLSNFDPSATTDVQL